MLLHFAILSKPDTCTHGRRLYPFWYSTCTVHPWPCTSWRNLASSDGRSPPRRRSRPVRSWGRGRSCSPSVWAERYKIKPMGYGTSLAIFWSIFNQADLGVEVLLWIGQVLPEYWLALVGIQDVDKIRSIGHVNIYVNHYIRNFPPKFTNSFT